MPALPDVNSLTVLFDWSKAQFSRVGADSQPLVAHFHEYLLRGGFPQCALAPSVDLAQKLLREDIVDKVLKRDMAAIFGVRRVLELEQTFLYLCLHDGGLLDIVAQVPGRLVPFEVKYSHQHTGAGELKGLIAFRGEKKVARGYVITREMSDFSVPPLHDSPSTTQLLKIPAPLACYWLGQSEIGDMRGQDEEHLE